MCSTKRNKYKKQVLLLQFNLQDQREACILIYLMEPDLFQIRESLDLLGTYVLEASGYSKKLRLEISPNVFNCSRKLKTY